MVDCKSSRPSFPSVGGVLGYTYDWLPNFWPIEAPSLTHVGYYTMRILGVLMAVVPVTGAVQVIEASRRPKHI